MSELGKKLKAQRVNLQLSLSEASLSTKIGARMISAIEEGDYKALPALPFAKGFVRSYANYLKLNADEMVDLYLHEIGERHEETPAEVQLEKPEPAVAPIVELNGESSGIMRFFIIGAVIVLIVAIVGVKSLVDKYKREGELAETPEVAISPIEKKADEEGSDEVAEETNEVEETSAAAPTVEVTPPAVTPTPAPAPEPSPAPAAVTEQPVAKVVEAPKPEAPKPEAPPPPAEAPVVAADTKKQVEILLEALDQVQISLSAGGQSKKVSLNAGEVHVLRTEGSVQLDISDGGAVNLVVNGRNRGVPGSLGQRKKVQLP